MKSKGKYFLLAVVTLIAALVFSTTVFAESEDTPEVPAAPEENILSPLPEAETIAEELAEETLVAEPAPEAPAAEDAVSDEEPIDIEGELSEDAPMENAIEEAVEPTAEVFLVDADGQPLDMATQPAGDPYWISGGVTYSSVSSAALCYPGTSVGAGTCFISATPIQNAINLIADNSVGAPDDGFLYVEYGTYPDLVTIDGGLAGGYLNNLLGLKGEMSGSGLYPVLSKSLTLINLINGFTLDGFTIKGGVIVKDSSGPFVFENVAAKVSMTDVDASGNTGNGIYVSNSKGDITLNRVTANNNGLEGILILNHAGHFNFDYVTANDNGHNGAGILNQMGKFNITIKNSEFNHNGLTEGISGSLSIWSNGLVTLNGVIANDSNDTYGGSGIRVRSGGATLRNVIANNNAGYGIHVQLRSGSLLLENAFANGNGSDGIRLELRDSGDNEISYLANVTMKNVDANNNSGGGIWVKTRGAVTLTNCEADNNSGGNGIFIATSGAVRIVSTYANVNGGNGLMVEGIYTEEFHGGGFERVAMASPASITITNPTLLGWSNGYWNNGGAGIYLITQRAVAISNFDVGQNQNEGLSISGPYLYDPAQGFSVLWRSGAVTISASIPNNYNNANENSLGVSIYSAGNVSVIGLNTWENRYHALEIDTLGSITVRNLHDTRNGTDGGSNSVALYNDQAAGFMPVTMTNITINENLGDWGAGLLVHSKGTITINGLTMDSNNSMGAALGNAMAGKGTINISNVSINSSNNGDGLQAFSNGAILLKNVHISNNSGLGAYLDNAGAPTAMVITMTDCSFDNNGGLGVQALSMGTITARNMIANGNGGGGIELINNYGPAGVSVTSLTADSNNGTGINIQTNGSIVANSIMALNNVKTVGGLERYETTQDYYNANRGPDRWWFYAEEGESYTLLMQANGYGTPGLLNRWDMDPYMELYDEQGSIVSLISTSHSINSYYQIGWTPGSGESGWYYLEASADADGFYRVSFDDASPSDPDIRFWVSGFGYGAGGNVTVSGSSMFHNNSLGGLIGFNTGTVSMTNLNVRGNGTEGVYVDNTGGTKNVTLSGNNQICGNGWEGLRIDTNGAVNVANVNVSNNGQSGAYIRANGTGKAVTLLNVTSMENSLKGLDIESYGLTTLNNIRAWFNGEDGAEVDTHGYNLRLMNSTFMLNNGYGFVYWDYAAPFTFTNTNNIFLGNGSGPIRKEK
jgi:hypothetical protein